MPRITRTSVIAITIPILLSCDSETKNEDVAVATGYPAIGFHCAGSRISDSGEREVFLDIDSRDLSCGELVYIEDPLTSIGSQPNTGEGNITFDNEELFSRSIIASVNVTNQSSYRDHSALSLILHNGEARVRALDSVEGAGGTLFHPILWGVYSASFLVELDLGSASAEQFQGGIFEIGDVTTGFVPEQGQNFLGWGFVWMDTDGDGRVSVSDKQDVVSGGRVIVTGDRPNIVFDLDLVLENGGSLIGTFTGDYVYVPDFVFGDKR